MWIKPKTSYYGQHGSFPAGIPVEVSEDTLKAIEKELNTKRSAMPKKQRHLLPEFTFDTIPAPWNMDSPTHVTEIAGIQSTIDTLQVMIAARTLRLEENIARTERLICDLQTVRRELEDCEQKGLEKGMQYLMIEADRLGHEIVAAELASSQDRLQIEIWQDDINALKSELVKLQTEDPDAADTEGQDVQTGPDHGPAENATATETGK